MIFEKKIFWQNLKNSCWILPPFLSEAVEAVWGQNKFIWWIKHKFPLLKKPPSISFWYICQNIWSSQVFTLCQNLMVDPVLTRDEFKLEFSGSSEPKLWRFRVEPSRAGALQFSSWNRAEHFYNQISKFSTSIKIITNSNQLYDHLYEFI